MSRYKMNGIRKKIEAQFPDFHVHIGSDALGGYFIVHRETRTFLPDNGQGRYHTYKEGLDAVITFKMTPDVFKES